MFNFDRLIERRFLLYLSSSIASLLIIFSRRPDAILNPQFWAEDGKVWFADAYNRGAIFSFFTPEAGYYQTISRLTAVISQAFPLASAPLIFNLTAIGCKILVVNFLLSSRLAHLIPSIYARVLIAFVYLALPYSYETNANITNAQWHLALLSFLIIAAVPSRKIIWRVFDIPIIVISSLSGPFCLLLIPVAAVKWFKTRDSWTVGLLSILCVASAIQLTSLLTTDRPSHQPLGATIDLFLQIVGGHLFLTSFVGDRNYARLFNRGTWTAWAAIPVNLLGFAALIYAIVKANLELRLFILFSALIVFGALLSPAASNTIPQWQALATPGNGGRYWLIPIFCWLVALFYIAKNAAPAFLRYGAVALLVFSLFGIVADWKYPRFKDLEFQQYAAEFEAAPAGKEVTIPINPDWEMRLVKKETK